MSAHACSIKTRKMGKKPGGGGAVYNSRVARRILNITRPQAVRTLWSTLDHFIAAATSPRASRLTLRAPRRRFATHAHLLLFYETSNTHAATLTSVNDKVSLARNTSVNAKLAVHAAAVCTARYVHRA